jgi:hypothetical protein
VQNCLGVGTQYDRYKTIGEFGALAESESLEFKVPLVCFPTGCVSRRRDGH